MKLTYKLRKYPSTKDDNEYLAFFAECGFMVEALARALYPNGFVPRDSSGETSVKATYDAIQSDSCDLFEPTFEYEEFSARIDILSKSRNNIDLIEIKAKSFDPEDDSDLFDKNGNIKSEWREYIYDVAFQTMVVRGATGCAVRPMLCVVDKSKTSTEEAIYSKIRLVADDDLVDFSTPRAEYTGDISRLMNDHLLHFMDVSRYVDAVMPEILAQAEAARRVLRGAGDNIDPPLSSNCRDCEYRNDSDVQNGFAECWGGSAPKGSHLVDLYFAGQVGGKGGLNDLIASGVRSVGEIPDAIIKVESARGRRQSMQISAFRSAEEVVNRGAFRVLNTARYPLYFLDFETSRIPVPYHVGMNPYEQVPFQFSCHVLESSTSTSLRHEEWLNVRDQYPSQEFASELRRVVGDSGTIFVWSPFEQSALRDLVRQNEKYGRIDADLVSWLEVTREPHADGGRIIDLMKVCLDGYCHPRMGGSTSIKKVLDAIWQESDDIRQHEWFRDYLALGPDGAILSPYEALPPATHPILAADDDETPATVRHGVDAMRAYQDMLYGVHRDDEAFKKMALNLLLQYCKLDTMAMVIIWKYWTDHYLDLSNTN